MTRISIDEQKCVCCGDCARLCPVKVYTHIKPPCQAACPIETDIQGYVSYIAQGNFEEAFNCICATNPLPLTVGRVCTHPCEIKCSRGRVDEAVAICSLKRTAADEIMRSGRRVRQQNIAGYPEDRVAVIGSGPAGLAAAHSLVLKGYPVTIFESRSVPGGMLAWGIPDFRLPKELVRKDIENIEGLGVEIRAGVTVGKDLSLDDLLNQGFKTVLLAIGAQKGHVLGLPGEVGPGVMHCLDMMRALRTVPGVKLGEEVVVIGGGNVAIDGARTALRLGARKVTIVCLEDRGTMPAGGDEIDAAMEEGVSLLPSRQCLRVLRQDGAVSGVQTIALRSLRFANGKPLTDPISGSEQIVPANTVIVATGQSPDTESIEGLTHRDLNNSGHLATNALSGAMRQQGLFAAGDAAGGPATVIDAIAAGQRAARGIVLYLRNETASRRPAPQAIEPILDKLLVNVLSEPRARASKLPMVERTRTFDEVEQGLSGTQAMAEARRCLGCGVFGVVETQRCCGPNCSLCQDNCWQQAILVAADAESNIPG